MSRLKAGWASFFRTLWQGFHLARAAELAVQTDTPPHAHAPAAGRRYCKFDEGGTQYQGLCDPTNGHCYDVYKYDMAVAKMRVRSRLAKGRGQSRGRGGRLCLQALANRQVPTGPQGQHLAASWQVFQLPALSVNLIRSTLWTCLPPRIQSTTSTRSTSSTTSRRRCRWQRWVDVPRGPASGTAWHSRLQALALHPQACVGQRCCGGCSAAANARPPPWLDSSQQRSPGGSFTAPFQLAGSPGKDADASAADHGRTRGPTLNVIQLELVGSEQLLSTHA